MRGGERKSEGGIADPIGTDPVEECKVVDEGRREGREGR